MLFYSRSARDFLFTYKYFKSGLSNDHQRVLHFLHMNSHTYFAISYERWEGLSKKIEAPLNEH
jgi:hypothetical protein